MIIAPASLRSDYWMLSVGISGCFPSESVAAFAGIRTLKTSFQNNRYFVYEIGATIIGNQIERFFRACGISCGEAPLFSVSGFVADLLEAIPQSQSRVIGHRAHGRYEQAFSTLSATRVLKSDDRILQRSG